MGKARPLPAHRLESGADGAASDFRRCLYHLPQGLAGRLKLTLKRLIAEACWREIAVAAYRSQVCDGVGHSARPDRTPLGRVATARSFALEGVTCSPAEIAWQR